MAGTCLIDQPDGVDAAASQAEHGHAPEVFVSNAGPENELAAGLCDRLRERGIGFFHYRWGNTIELGSLWRDGLRDRLRESRFFVALLTRAYWSSDVCAEEYRVA